MATSFGAYSAISSLFILPLQSEFAWSRRDLAMAHNAPLAAAMVSPFLRRVIDQWGVRPLMLGGMLLTALVYLGLASMNGSLPLYYVLYVTAAVTGLTASGLTCSRVISQVFIQSRGFSLAVARSGLALAGAALPVLLYLIIERLGWRAGYVAEALLVILIAFPAVYFWIDRSTRERPVVSKHDRVGLPGWGELLRNVRAA